jgi:hypothetical protein
MPLTVLSRSRAFRAMCLFMAAAMTYSASAAGLNAVALSAAEIGSQILRVRAPHFTECPTTVLRGDNPRRDALRSSWWTLRFQRDLVNTEFSRERDQAVQRGEVFASIDPSPLVPLLIGQVQGGVIIVGSGGTATVPVLAGGAAAIGGILFSPQIKPSGGA